MKETKEMAHRIESVIDKAGICGRCRSKVREIIADRLIAEDRWETILVWFERVSFARNPGSAGLYVFAGDLDDAALKEFAAAWEKLSLYHPLAIVPHDAVLYEMDAACLAEMGLKRIPGPPQWWRRLMVMLRFCLGRKEVAQ